ncbi:MAG TPA: hypothetical protein VH539_09575 [Gemmatimonadaceae bacterium]|jgi:hypothetical protein
MYTQLRRTIAWLGVALASTACGPFHRGGQPEAAVVFHNQSPDQADVYALGPGGDPQRIGTVFAGRTEALRVSSSVTGGADRVNVIARIFPSGRVVATGPFTLAPGDQMDVTLSSDERLLSVLPAATGH